MFRSRFVYTLLYSFLIVGGMNASDWSAGDWRSGRADHGDDTFRRAEYQESMLTSTDLDNIVNRISRNIGSLSAERRAIISEVSEEAAKRATINYAGFADRVSDFERRVSATAGELQSRLDDASKVITDTTRASAQMQALTKEQERFFQERIKSLEGELNRISGIVEDANKAQLERLRELEEQKKARVEARLAHEKDLDRLRADRERQLHEDRVKAERDLLEQQVIAETEKVEKREAQKRKEAEATSLSKKGILDRESKENVARQKEHKEELLVADLQAQIKAAEMLKEVAIQESIRKAQAESAARADQPEYFEDLAKHELAIAEQKAKQKADINKALKRELFTEGQDREDKRHNLAIESSDRQHELTQKTRLEIVKNVLNFFKSPRHLAYLGLTIGGTAGMIYALRLGFRQYERYLNRPRLVRDTSHRGLFSKRKVVGPRFKDMIVSPELSDELQRVMQSASYAYKHGTNLPNVGLFGPPGTGKTMFIEALANESGMTYAKMTGGDVSALLSSGGENTAVTEIHKLFDWLEAHGPAVLLVDEADAFLRSGRDGSLSEGLTAAINAFLSRTGSSSSRVMVVFATNYPQSLDGAVQNRISSWIHVGRPAFTERKKMIAHYFKELVRQGLGKRHLPVQIGSGITSDYLTHLAQKTEGFAGRDIKMKLMDVLERELARIAGDTVQSKYVITPELADKVLERTLEQERRRLRWVAGDRPDFNGIAEAMNAGAAAAA